MARKPAPTKLVMLLSAAGLSLSWSGAALASREDNAAPNFALTFDGLPGEEQGCNSQATDGSVPCTTATASSEYLHKFAAQAATLARPQPSVPSNQPDLPVVVQPSEISSRDPEVAAITAVSLDTPPVATGAVRTGDEEAASADPKQIDLVWDSLAEVLGSRLDEEPPIEIQSPRRVAAPAVPEPAVDTAGKTASVGPLHEAARPHTNEGQATLASAPIEAVWASLAEVLGSRLGEESSIEIQSPQRVAAPAVPEPAVDTAGKTASVGPSREPARPHTNEGQATLASAPIEAVWASSAEILGSQLDEPPSAIKAPKQAVQTDDAGNHSDALARWEEADDIVVASSHSQKILSSLAALRSGESPETGAAGSQTKKVVVRHTDKVLETLALFHQKKTTRKAFLCTGAPEDEMPPRVPPMAQGWSDLADASTATMFEPEVDILLDLAPPMADISVKPMAQETPSRPAPPDPLVAGPAHRAALGSEAVALSADKLDKVRGGFTTTNGAWVSFGIERAVYLNGELVTTTSLNIADLSKISGGQAQVTSNGAVGSLAVLQSGAGNVFTPGTISSTAAGTVIQNTLDNQKINTITRIDAVVNSSSIMRSMNLQSSMQSAIVNSLRR